MTEETKALTSAEAKAWWDWANSVANIAEGTVSGVRGKMCDLRSVSAYNKRMKMISESERKAHDILVELSEHEHLHHDKNANRILNSVRYLTWEEAADSVDLSEELRELVKDNPNVLMFTPLGEKSSSYQGDLSRKYWFALTRRFDLDAPITDSGTRECLYRQMSVAYAQMFANCIIKEVTNILDEQEKE